MDKKTLSGYIKAYIPGTRENGGQYTHGAIWTIIAEAMLGFGEKAVETVLKNGYELTWRGTYYAKGGMRGSMLQIIPDKNRVVAWTACDDSDTHDLLNLGVQI